ncbi:zinc ribbon domain-containing protein [uncultured Methanobrevibacter sp.]|uniref:zinc ribbon domain-containing protein n=1 Tax=uncultured Methanobrevibacter sp. TaxID=253161 RepID=UPI00345B59F4
MNLYTLLQMIKYKAEWYGKKFIQIDRYYPSSKKCRHCGKNKPRIKTPHEKMEMPKL